MKFSFNDLKFGNIYYDDRAGNGGGNMPTVKVRLDDSLDDSSKMTFSDLKQIALSLPVSCKDNLLRVFEFTDDYNCWMPLKFIGKEFLFIVFQLLNVIGKQQKFIDEQFKNVESKDFYEAEMKKKEEQYKKLFERCEALEKLVTNMDREVELSNELKNLQTEYDKTFVEIETLRQELGFSKNNDEVDFNEYDEMPELCSVPEMTLKELNEIELMNR